MNIGEQLDEIKDQAGKDPKLYEAFLETRKQTNPLAAFCENVRSWDTRSMRWI